MIGYRELYRYAQKRPMGNSLCIAKWGNTMDMLDKNSHSLPGDKVTIVSDSYALRKLENGNYELEFDAESGKYSVNLSPNEMQNIGLQCLLYFPWIEPSLKMKSIAETYRLPAQKIKLLDNRSIQLLLRETQSETLVDFLWFMKDADLMRLIFKNMSSRAADMFLDDLREKYFGKNPDKTESNNGKEAAQIIVGTVNRLIDENQIPQIYGEAHA